MKNPSNTPLPKDNKGLDKQRDKYFKFIKADMSQPHLSSKMCSSWLISRATELIDAKRFEDANRDCLEAISLAPEEVHPHIKLAVIAYYQEKYQESIDILKMAPKTTKDILGHDEDNRFDILFYMGLSYIQMGKEEKGISCFRLALKIGKTVTEIERLFLEGANRPVDDGSEIRETMEEAIKLYEEENNKQVTKL